MAEIVLGVSGGIAAYKSIDTMRILQRRGHGVTVVMTRAAQRFVGPATFAALSGRPVGLDLFGRGDRPGYDHLELARGADLLLVAPASANTIARMAAGLGDGLLGSVHLAFDGPVVVAPAMNTRMYLHPATAHNLALLRARGVEIVDPGSGLLADGEVGVGRLAEPAVIADAVEAPARRGRLPGGSPGAGERGRHPRADRPGAVRGQPLQRAHGVVRGRGGAPARRRGDRPERQRRPARATPTSATSRRPPRPSCTPPRWPSSRRATCW